MNIFRNMTKILIKNLQNPMIKNRMNISPNMRKSIIKNLLKFILFFSILLVIFITKDAHAAKLRFEPALAEYKVGDSFEVRMVLDTEGQEINAAEVVIIVPDLLVIKGVAKSQSFVQLWIQEPSFTLNSVKFSGGVPGGVKLKNGLIGKVTFEAKAAGQGAVALDPLSAVFLNDGLGTKENLVLEEGAGFFSVRSKKQGEENEHLTAGDKQDRRKPKSFNLEIADDPRVFGGKKFVSFFTTDRDSGISRYEVKVGDGVYQIAQSPYLVDELPARTVIRVRAYDSDDNYRESVYPGFWKRFWWKLLNVF